MKKGVQELQEFGSSGAQIDSAGLRFKPKGRARFPLAILYSSTA
jgi:hypothetical protein